MKNTSILLIVLAFFGGCHQNGTIEFEPLHPAEFNAGAFSALTDAVLFDSVKNSYDSCKSFTFPANAIIISKRDSLFIGDVVNRHTLRPVNSLQAIGLTEKQMLPQVHIISTPCYEKHSLHIPARSLLGEHFTLQLPEAGEAVNKEINDALANAGNNEIQTGAWVYLDIKDVLPGMLDTMQGIPASTYKKDVRNPANMVLTTVESVTDISIFIKAQNAVSDTLQKVLEQKPLAVSPNPQFKIQLFSIDDKTFQVHFTGLFAVAGRFMKAE